MELISSKLKIDFLAKSKFAIIFSLALIVFSIFTWVSAGETKYGVDFKGGHEIIVGMNKSVSTNQLRDALQKEKIENAIVQEFEAGSGEFAIRLPGDHTNVQDIKTGVTAGIVSVDPNSTILSTNFIGPTIGSELRRSAVIAIFISLFGMLAYITYRFEFAFAMGAVVALFHDVIICLGLYLFFGKFLNMTTLAAALTIVGYSVNDTIIVFDRIREEMQKRNEFVLKDLVNFSINATLSRTVITSLLTFFSAMALLVFGGGAIADLALFLTIGIILGTYSTIFIASPVALAWEKYAGNKYNAESPAKSKS